MAKESQEHAPYDALALSQDATAFAKSRFGVHYVSRLTRLRDTYLDIAQNLEFSDSYRANHASKAAALASELEFFQIAQTIQATPSLLQRLKKKLMKGGDDKDV